MQDGASISAAQLAGNVADYAPVATQTAINKHPMTPLQNRAGQVDALVQRMAAISTHTAGKTGCLILLDDSVGNAIELGASRDEAALKVAQATGVFDTNGLRARRRVVAEMVEAVRANAEKAPGPWYDRNYGPERFMKHVDEAAVKAARADAQAFKDNIQLVEKRSVDYMSHIAQLSRWRQIQRWDFDAADDTSSLDHSHMVADSTRGSGATKVERELLWYPVLVDMQAADPDNWFYRAMSALHPDLQDYFDAAKQWDKEYEDVPKAAATLLRDISIESANEIARIHGAIRVKRAANDATADLISGVSSLLLHLREKDPKAFNKLIRRVTVALITRADLVAQPVVVTGRYNQIVQMIQSVATGDARLVGSAPVVVRPGAVDQSYAAIKGNLGGKGLKLSQGIDGAVLLDLPGDRNDVRNVTAWVVGRLQGGGALGADDLRKLKLINIDLTSGPSTVPANNVFLANRLDRLANQSNKWLSGFALFLQIVALSNAAKDLVVKPGGMDKGEAAVGVTTAVMSAMAATLEVYTAVVALKGGEAVARTAVRTRLIARLAGAASLIEGGWLLFKADTKRRAGDSDSAVWTFGSGVFLIAGGVTTIVGGGLVATAVGAGASALTVPVVGWAVATIIFLGLSIYCLINASSTDDTSLIPIEYWLDYGSFGKGAHRNDEENPFYDKKAKAAAKPFVSLIEEVRGFQQLVFAATGKIAGSRDRKNIGMVSFYQITIPRWIASSKLEIEFEGTSDGSTLRRIAFIRYLNGRDKPETLSYESRVFGLSQDPKADVDAAQGNT